VTLRTYLVTQIVLAFHQSHVRICSHGTSKQQQAASAAKSERGSCQDPLLANSWTFSHASCPSKSIKQLSTKYQHVFRCEHVVTSKGIQAHATSSTSFLFLFSSPFCTTYRTVSLILVYLVAFKPVSASPPSVQSPTKNVFLPLLITRQIQLDYISKKEGRNTACDSSSEIQ